MVAFHQFFEARLDLGCRGIDFEPECVERLAFGIAHRTCFLRRLFRASPRAMSELAQHIERIV